MACCVATGCSNRSNRKDLSFYRFPKDLERRTLWISAVNRGQWEPTEYSRLCSQHFISGEKSNDPQSPDYVPSLFGSDKTQKSSKQRAAKRIERSAMKLKKRDQKDRLTAASVLLGLAMAAAPADVTDQQSTEQSDQDILNDLLPDLQTDVQEEITDLADVQEEDELEEISDEEPETITELPPPEAHLQMNVKHQRDGTDDHNYFISSATCDKGTQCNKEPLYRHLLRTDMLCRLYTGLSLSAFHQLTRNLLPFNAQIFELDPIDQLLMTLMKLKLNLLLEDLAERFGVCPSGVSRIVSHWIDLMEICMKSYIPWLSKETIAGTMPQFFKSHYPGTTCIVDISEIKLKKPRRLDCWGDSFMRYDDEDTVKFMVAFAPCGLIMFISGAYGGKCSDTFIASDSGFLRYLQPLDEVMVERNFMISDALNERGVKLVIPACSKGLTRFNKDSAQKTSVYNVTIHMERVICRLKYYRILSESMPSSLTSKTDQILRICAALCNIRGENLHEELE
uniref:Si:dkey-56d12.4 n=3 Tax=Nothobranchius TaxID=28779 RepID=A0A1A8PLH0_9TELE